MDRYLQDTVNLVFTQREFDYIQTQYDGHIASANGFGFRDTYCGISVDCSLYVEGQLKGMLQNYHGYPAIEPVEQSLIREALFLKLEWSK